jgi:hypothetical protein
MGLTTEDTSALLVYAGWALGLTIALVGRRIANWRKTRNGNRPHG